MRSKPRKRKAERLSYRKNWKSCSTARTRVRLLLRFQQLSSALRSPFEALPLAVLCSVSVRLAFSSCLAVVVLPGGGDYLRLPFADVSLPFERYARPFGDYATFDSSHGVRERRLQPQLLCRYAFWPGFPRRFACCRDFRPWPCPAPAPWRLSSDSFPILFSPLPAPAPPAAPSPSAPPSPCPTPSPLLNDLIASAFGLPLFTDARRFLSLLAAC